MNALIRVREPSASIEPCAASEPDQRAAVEPRAGVSLPQTAIATLVEFREISTCDEPHVVTLRAELRDAPDLRRAVLARVQLRALAAPTEPRGANAYARARAAHAYGAASTVYEVPATLKTA